MPIEERLQNLALIKETLISDRKFYLSRKDWPRVKVLTENLKKCDEQFCRIRFATAIAA